MKALFEILAQIALELSPDRVSLLADKMATIRDATQLESIHKFWGPNMDKTLYNRFVDAAKKTALTGQELSIAFQSAAATASVSRKNGLNELIWTGPATMAVPVRLTEQALCELIDSARFTLFLVSFVAYKTDNVIKALRAAIQRNVNVSFLLEKSKSQGGNIDSNSQAILASLLPTAAFYTWNNATGSVHAKCAVADEKMAIITSANLTNKAMENNMELGILVKGGTIPMKLAKHFQALITEHIINKE